MNAVAAKMISFYDVPPSALVGLSSIPERDRVVVEFGAFDDIQAGHIEIPFRQLSSALLLGVKAPVVASSLSQPDPRRIEGLQERIGHTSALQPGGAIKLMRAELFLVVAYGHALEYSLGALNFTMFEQLRSRYATVVNGAIRADARSKARPGEWLSANPDYESGRMLFAHDVHALRAANKQRALRHAFARAESMGAGEGWMREARDHLRSLDLPAPADQLLDDGLVAVANSKASRGSLP